MAAGDSHITKHHAKAHDGGHHAGHHGHAHINAADLQGHHSYTHHADAKAHDKDKDSDKHLVFHPAHKAFAKQDADHGTGTIKHDATKHDAGKHDATAKHDTAGKPETIAKHDVAAKSDAASPKPKAKVDTAHATSDHLDTKTVASKTEAAHRGIRQAEATPTDGKADVTPGHAVAADALKTDKPTVAHLEVPPVKVESVGISKREKDTSPATIDTARVLSPKKAEIAQPGAAASPVVQDKTVVSPGAEKLAAGEKPSISVQFGDKPNENSKPYTFRVDTQGKILDSQGQEVAKHVGFDHGVPKDIVIKVDKPENFDKMAPQEQNAITANQQAHLNDFVRNTLNPALRAASPEIANTGINVQDTTNSLKPDSVKELTQSAAVAPSEKPVVAPQTEYSKPEQQAFQHMNGRHGMRNGSHGEMPREHADSFFPSGTPKMANETNDRAARRDTLAASFNPDKEDPYGTRRLQGDGHSIAVGRYGHSYNHFNHLMHHALGQAMQHWSPEIMAQLTDKDGNIDWSKLSDVLKQHPELMKDVQDSVKNAGLPDALADKFSDADKLGQFGNFVQKLRGDNGEISKDELAKNFGKDAQDAMAQQTVDAGIKAGKTGAETALAQHLGLQPDQLTDAQKNDPANKAFLDAATKFEALANARENPGQYGDKRSYDKFDWSVNQDGTQARAEADLNPQSAHQMAAWAREWAKTNETVDPRTGTGNCTRLWRRAIERVTGKDIGSMSGVQQTEYMAKLAQQGYFRRVSESEAQEGDFGGRAWSRSVAAAHGRNLGDTFMVAGRNGSTVYGVNGAAHNAFVANNNSPRYTANVYFRPTEKFKQLFKDGNSDV